MFEDIISELSQYCIKGSPAVKVEFNGIWLHYLRTHDVSDDDKKFIVSEARKRAK